MQTTTSVRIVLEVVAGVLPGTPIQEYTKQFIITNDMWYAQGEYEGKQEEAKMEILKIYGWAQEYARNLMNPQVVNWVKVEWIYF
jgi:hypothetical protein